MGIMEFYKKKLFLLRGVQDLLESTVVELESTIFFENSAPGAPDPQDLEVLLADLATSLAYTQGLVDATEAMCRLHDEGKRHAT
jgi:hypothetical protein